MLLEKINQLSLSIRYTVISFFILATTLVAFVAIGFQFHFSKKIAIENSTSSYQQSAVATREFLNKTDENAKATAVFLSKFVEFDDSKHPIDSKSFELFASLLKSNPLYYAIYIGMDDGGFYELINLDVSSIVREEFDALPSDKWVKITVIPTASGQNIKRTEYIDFNGNIRATRETNTEYDPRNRPWYQKAGSEEVHKTAPYLFQHLKKPGLTYSKTIPDQNAVVAVDIALTSVSELLKSQATSKSSEIYIYDADGNIIASNQGEESSIEITDIPLLDLNEQQQAFIKKDPVILVSNELDWAPFDYAISGKPYGYAIDVLDVISKMSGLEFDYVNGLSWNQLVEIFNRDEIDILQPVASTYSKTSQGIQSDAFLSADFGVITQNNIADISNIKALRGKRIAIPAGWSIIDHISTLYPDITIVIVPTVQAMFDEVRAGNVYAGIDTALSLSYNATQYFYDDIKIHQPLDFSPNTVPSNLHFMISERLPVLAEIINMAIAEFPEKAKHILQNKWQSSQLDKNTNQLATVPYQSLLKLTDSFNQLHYQEINGAQHLIYVTPLGNNGNQFFAAVTPMSTLLAPAMDKVQTSILYTLLGIALLMPLCWVFSGPIVKPILRLAENASLISQRDYDDVVDVNSHIVEIQALADSMSSMAESIEQHEQVQQDLLDSFIQLIAQAIDDKSPYTAGHCERVPQLALMLANYASNHNQGPFQSFKFNSEEELREFHIAAWLHDCGKVTTPEHIVDKGSKLETIYNRIHEIRARFEILWRDAEIRYLNNVIATPDKQTALLAHLKAEQQKLSTEYEFVAKANVGGEFMSDEHVAQLHEIGQQTWLRHFDDSLGLSPIEENRYQASSKDLPATEYLLADKPEHIIPRGGEGTDYDPSYGIKIDVPENLYNLGELHNLSISRGTLTVEDRFKINEHIISTIKMLETLPLPPELSRVPRYASTHHETLKGTGYPRKLVAEDLSIPERIMVLADIFEALTAADRPYKKAKPLSLAIDILHKMVLDDHVDTDVFELFLTSGIYLQYAHQFLSESQIDNVDINKYLGT